MLRIAWTWTGSVHDAQDICQTVLLKLLTSPRRFAEERLERPGWSGWPSTAARTGRNPPGSGGACRWRRRPTRRSICRSRGRALCWRRCRPCRSDTARRCTCGITRDTSRRRSGR
ncbi:MAG: hypothetical protein ACLTYN_12995 [Dysosmobacter welbionis]